MMGRLAGLATVQDVLGFTAGELQRAQIGDCMQSVGYRVGPHDGARVVVGSRVVFEVRRASAPASAPAELFAVVDFTSSRAWRGVQLGRDGFYAAAAETRDARIRQWTVGDPPLWWIVWPARDGPSMLEIRQGYARDVRWLGSSRALSVKAGDAVKLATLPVQYDRLKAGLTASFARALRDRQRVGLAASPSGANIPAVDTDALRQELQKAGASPAH